MGEGEINRTVPIFRHPLFQRESRKASAQTMYIARLVTQEISLMKETRSPLLVYTYVDTYENDDTMNVEVIAMKMAGIREVRASFASYSSGSEPFLVTRHGKVSGVYIPLEAPDQLPDDWRREIGKILSYHFSRLLESEGIKERDVREDFRAYRSRRRRR